MSGCGVLPMAEHGLPLVEHTMPRFHLQGVCNCCLISTGMHKEFFFQVWVVYRHHWGVDNQRQKISILSRQHLRTLLSSSLNIRHLLFLCHHFGKIPKAQTWNHTKDFIAACLGEEYDYFKKGHCYDPMLRECVQPSSRYRQSLGVPLRSTEENSDSLCRVYAIVALFHHRK